MEAQLFKFPTYVFLAVAILAKGNRPDFNNGRILAPRCLFESDSNNGPLPRPFQVCVKWRHSCSSFLLMFSWLLPYWPRATGLTSVMAQEVTQIMAAFWPPGVYSNLTQIMAPSPGHSNFVSNGGTAVQVSYLCFPGCCHMWPRPTGLTSIMAQEVTQIMVAFWPPGVYSSLTRIMAPRPFQFCVKCRHSCSQLGNRYI